MAPKVNIQRRCTYNDDIPPVATTSGSDETEVVSSREAGGNAEGHAKPGSCLLCCIKSTLSAAFRSHTLSLCPALATCNAICPLLSRRNHSHSFWRLTKDRFALNCPAVLPRQILSGRYPHPSIAGFKRHNAQGQCVLIHLPCKHARNLVQCCSKMWTHSLRKNHT